MSEALEEMPSVRRQIAILDVGASFSVARRLELELLTKAILNERTAALRNVLGAATRRAAESTGNDYHVETGTFFTASRDLMLVAVVTRRN